MRRLRRFEVEAHVTVEFEVDDDVPLVEVKEMAESKAYEALQWTGDWSSDEVTD